MRNIGSVLSRLPRLASLRKHCVHSKFIIHFRAIKCLCLHFNMYPSVKREIPEFVKEYLVFSDCFVNINKQKTCLVLTKNLKFYEFHQKQLMGSIDLHQTCLNKIKHELENYHGPNGKLYETSLLDEPVYNISATRTLKSTMETSYDRTENNNSAAKPSESGGNISFGKYVFHAINSYKIYIIIQCWDKCLILSRLPDFKGYEIKAEYENLQSYRITHGQIKYCPLIELKFQNNELIRTDFEDGVCPKTVEMDFDNKSEFKQLLERVRSAKTELQLHKSITAHSFQRLQKQLTHGLPYLRSIKLEEKQILSRCGDIWKRFTPQYDLVIGIPLVNQCAPPNLTIIRNLKPLLQPNNSPENSIRYQFRLYQLKLKFDQLDSLETFLQTGDEQLQTNIWEHNENLKILPETFIVLLIKFKISQIISLKECPLILTYEVLKDFRTTLNTTEPPVTMPLQIFLQILDFHKILHKERSKHELQFFPQTLHQDFLTIATTSRETKLKILFQSYKDLEIFEQHLQEKFEFVVPTNVSKDDQYNNSQNRLVLYNKKPNSLWFGCLLLRLQEIREDEVYQYLTTWTIYCQNLDKTLLLIQILLNDLLTIQCSILSIDNCDNKHLKSVGEFENTLRQELLRLQKLLNNKKNENLFEESSDVYVNLCKAEMNSDILAKDLMEN